MYEEILRYCAFVLSHQRERIHRGGVVQDKPQGHGDQGPASGGNGTGYEVLPRFGMTITG